MSQNLVVDTVCLVTKLSALSSISRTQDILFMLQTCIKEVSDSRSSKYDDGYHLGFVVSCNMVEVYQRFPGTCCLHHQGREKART